MATQLKAGVAPPEADLEMCYQFSMLDWLFQGRSPDGHPTLLYVYICHIHNNLSTALWTLHNDDNNKLYFI